MQASFDMALQVARARCTAPTPDSTYYQGHVSGKPDFPHIVSHKRYGAH